MPGTTRASPHKNMRLVTNMRPANPASCVSFAPASCILLPLLGLLLLSGCAAPDGLRQVLNTPMPGMPRAAPVVPQAPNPPIEPIATLTPVPPPLPLPAIEAASIPTPANMPASPTSVSVSTTGCRS